VISVVELFCELFFLGEIFLEDDETLGTLVEVERAVFFGVVLLLE